jgi:hypothetical protein
MQLAAPRKPFPKSEAALVADSVNDLSQRRARRPDAQPEWSATANISALEELRIALRNATNATRQELARQRGQA